jgi:Na+-transporting methylmalonyl-CoA/oxaloacetate decarboxylase gamma subunit
MEIPEALQQLEILFQYPYYLIVMGVLAFLFLCLLIARVRRMNRAIVPFKTQGGRVEIAPKTIHGILQHTVVGIPGVEKASCCHRQRGSKLQLQVNIHILATAKLKELETEIKHRIRSVMRFQFGMENIDPIHIRVTRLVGEPMPQYEPQVPVDTREESTEPNKSFEAAAEDRRSSL